MSTDAARTDPAPRARDTWFPFRRGAPAARVRLFCFPHAGAGAYAYQPWARALGADVEVCAVELPGRGSRAREDAHRRWEPAVRAAGAALRGLADRPYVLHGHSMGALLAYEACRALEAGGGPGPAALVVSGMAAPSRWPVRPPVHHLPAPELLVRAADFTALAEEDAADEDVLALLLPVLRADLELSETYRHRPGRPLRCPVTVLSGEEDPFTRDPEAVQGWRDLTGGGCEVHTFPGGHFFLHEDPGPVLRVVRAVCGAAAGPAGPGGGP